MFLILSNSKQASGHLKLRELFSVIIIANICVAPTVCQPLCFVHDTYIHLILVTTQKYALLLSHFRVEETKTPKQWGMFIGNPHQHPTKYRNVRLFCSLQIVDMLFLDFIRLLRQSRHLPHLRKLSFKEGKGLLEGLQKTDCRK